MMNVFNQPITLVAALLCVASSIVAPGVSADDSSAAAKIVVPRVTISAEDRAKIEQAIPAKAPVAAVKPRKLLIFLGNVGYGGHPSALYAAEAFTQMGRKTGAFETVVASDPAIFAPNSLRRFDAVFFNNNVGNLFDDPALRRSLIEFVYAGGGLMGVHGTTVAFTRWPGAFEDWPEFGLMLGARGANHREADEPVVLKLDDPSHPLVGPFGGKPFEYRDEFFRVYEPYSRDRVRVLLSIDARKTDLDRGPWRGRRERPDNDYALAWVRHCGRGRVFYCTIAHNPRVFWDPKMLEFYLGAAQFALGDLPAATIPSARLTPEVRAQEQLGWRLALTAYTFHKYTLFEAIDKTAKLGLSYMEGLSFQKVSKEIPKDFDPKLSDDEIARIRRKLDGAGIRMLTYYYHNIPGDEAGCRKVFEFGRKIGIEAFLSEPDPKALPAIEKFCDEYAIDVALHNHDAKASPHYWSPDAVLKTCEGRSPRIGACVDLGYWMRSGIDPIAGARKLKGRLMTIQMHDLDRREAEAHDVPWGTGAGQTRRLLQEIHALGIRPIAFGLEYSYNWHDSMPEVAECAAFFGKTCRELAPASK
jgi:sugar phosphate isomerase/epimerase/type 1 glutamine amidotransferase